MNHHGEHRQHLLEDRRVEAGSRRGALRHGAAHLARAEDLAEDLVAVAHVRGLGAEHLVQQAAAAQLPQQSAEPLDARGLALRLLLEAPEDRRQQRLRALPRLALAHAQLARHRLQSAHAREDVGHFHGRSPVGVPLGYAVVTRA
jgi:hypothetical protein